MSELFRDIPEFVETDIGESITARTETLASFRELGPPDLCHVVKSIGAKTQQRDVGSYHYCSGVEASSSASLAAYLNSLQFSVEDSSAWFSKGTGWRVRTGTYCCFNAFSRVDIRVDVKIPGGVDAYVVDLRGDRHEATPELWQETYLSALLRSIRYADDASYRLAGYRKLDPITTPDAEIRFLKAAEVLFFKGWQLGSDPEVQVATVVSNHLTAAIIKYFSDSFRLERAANLFERMYAREPEVAALLAQSYLGMNEEIKAVQVMHDALAKNPQSYPVLHAQCDFLLSKGKPEWARRVAQQAVDSAPSEFLTWAKLTESCIDLGQYEQALLTLNSCPMFTYNERDLHRMPTPAKTHLPIVKFIADSNILDEDSGRDHEAADVALLRLPAPGLRGTFARAYSLLAFLVSKIGWDELLKSRSAVFVMEEEYRAQKASGAKGGNGSLDASDNGSAITVLHEHHENGNGNGHGQGYEGVNGSGEGEVDADENASTKAMRSPIVVTTPDHANSESGPAGPSAKGEGEGSEGIPTIRISSESTRGGVAGAAAGTGKEKVSSHMEPPILEKPETAQAAEEGNGETTAAGGIGATGTGVTGDEEEEKPYIGSAFSNKRLCERWLDNLFLVLYEDLRVYTIWRAEISHFKTQHMSYRKTGTEWEILGELALRLHHKEEAKDAFQRCLDAKFSAKALLRLLEMYANEGDLQRTLNTAIKLTTYHHRWYMTASYPSIIAHYLYKLGLVHGHAKIQYTLLSMNLPVGIFEIMQGYMKYAQTFGIEGSEF